MTLPLDQHNLKLSFSALFAILTAHLLKAVFYEHFLSPLLSFQYFLPKDVLCSHGFNSHPEADGAKRHISLTNALLHHLDERPLGV